MNNSTVILAPHPSTGFWTIDTLEICMLSFNFSVGLLIHSYIIHLIMRSGMASEFFNLNLSVCEMFVSLNSLFIMLTKCSLSVVPLTEFIFGLGITGCPLFQCLICVERYLAVVHPVTFLKFKPLRYRVICAVVVWIITLGSCLCCLFILVALDVYIYIWFFSVQFLLFLSIKLFCLSAVLRALKQSGPGERGREREEENHIKRRAFYIILIITVSKIITYVPFTVTGILTIVTQAPFQVLWSFSFICLMLAGFLQPVLYLRRKLKVALCFQ